MESFNTTPKLNEGMGSFKKSLRECLEQHKQLGTQGVRGMIEVATNRMERILDTQDESCPNPMTETDLEMAKDCCERLKKLRNSVKRIKECSTGMYNDSKPTTPASEGSVAGCRYFKAGKCTVDCTNTGKPGKEVIGGKCPFTTDADRNKCNCSDGPGKW